MKSLFAEFKRRNVFRVAVLYLVCAWLIAQVADVVVGLGELPPTIGRVVLIILALGFPVTVVLAWVFEWTPQGIRLESEDALEPATERSAGRRLDYVIIALLSVALVYFVATHDWQGSPQFAGASIAVLPFENRSALPDDLYFTDGIHEDILTQLGKISSMVVISRTSVMRYRDSGMSIPEIARELGVATILEGGVQRAGERVRINLQLIDAASDRHLWAETYDRALSAENVFAIQSEVAAAIADALHARLLPQELERVARVPTHNLEAYDAYLLGRRHMARRLPDELAKAREYFERAVAIDPGFALAHSGLADTLLLLATYDGGLDADTQIAEAEVAAGKALELNPELGEAHTSFGIVRQRLGDPPKVFAPYLERGVALAPNSADARKWYANYLSESNRPEEALEQYQIAVQLDPMSPIIRVNLAAALRRLGRHEEAAVHIKRALEIDPQFYPALAEAWVSSPVDRLVLTSNTYRAYPKNPWTILNFVFEYLDLRDDIRAGQWAAELDRLAPESIQALTAHLSLTLYQSQQTAALEYANKLLGPESVVYPFPSRTLLWHDLRHGELSAAMDRYENKYPDLLSDDPQVTGNYPAAIDVAMLLLALGETRKADRLFDRSLEFMAGLSADEVRDYGVFEARIHAMRGRTEEALAAIRKAIDAGWTFFWWYYLEQDPVFDTLRNDARFQALADEMNTLARQELEAVRQQELSGEIALPLAD